MSVAPDFLEFMSSRRSVSTLEEPGPTRDQLDRILRAAGSVPDHGELHPFRFVVAEGDGRGRFGDALAKTAAERRPDAPAALFEKVRGKAFRSPTLIALIASPKNGKIELWEQNATAACAGYAVILAAHALGVGAVWKSVPFTKGRALAEALGMNEQEEMLGWIHLGTPRGDEPASQREPLDLGVVASVLDGEGRRPY